jgi:hypothetical protein
MESAAEIAGGVLVELVVLGIAAAVLYRYLAGRFLIPKREIVLPQQRGVLVAGDRQLRTVEPGRCWVRPGQKLLLCDVRPRKLQLEGFEVLAADAAVLRLSIAGEYAITDPMAFLRCSGNPGDGVYFDLRRLLTTTARHKPALSITASPQLFAASVREALNHSVAANGITIQSLDIWDILQSGRIQSTVAVMPASEIVH